MSPRRVRSRNFKFGRVYFSRDLVEESRFLGVLRAGEGQAKENVCDNGVLAFLVLDIEVIFREAKDSAFDPGNRGQIGPKKIAKGCVICLQK